MVKMLIAQGFNQVLLIAVGACAILPPVTQIFHRRSITINSPWLPGRRLLLEFLNTVHQRVRLRYLADELLSWCRLVVPLGWVLRSDAFTTYSLVDAPRAVSASGSAISSSRHCAWPLQNVLAHVQDSAHRQTIPLPGFTAVHSANTSFRLEPHR
jgi:hypothetical protein